MQKRYDLFHKKKKDNKDMTKEEFIRSSDEWQALNRIWELCTAEQRDAMLDDFELLRSIIRHKVGLNFRADNDDEFRYLNSISDEAKQFVISLVENGEPNIYHSIMAVLNNKKNITMEEIKNFYFAKYGMKRPYLCEKRELVNEVIELCYRNFYFKNRNKKGK